MKALQTVSTSSRPLGINGNKGLHLRVAGRRSFSTIADHSAGGIADEEVSDVEQTRFSGRGTTACSKPRVLARCRYAGGYVAATYEPHLRKLVLSISPVLKPTGSFSEETAAAAATADRLIKASFVCEAAKSRQSQRGRLEASAVSALVDYAFARGSRSVPHTSAAPSQRQAISFHLPSLSPSALSEVVYLCALGLSVRDHDFFSEVTRVALWQLDVLQRLRKGGPSPPHAQQQPSSKRDCPVTGSWEEGLEKRIAEAPVISSPRPGAHQVAKLLRGLSHTGHEDQRLFHAAVDYLETECTYTHSDLLHALALLKAMSLGAPRDKLAKLISQRILLRERRLPLCVIAAAANVFSLLQLHRSASSTHRSVVPETLQKATQPYLGASKTLLCATHTSAHASPAFSSPLPSTELFQSLASSAKRALEVTCLGIGGGTRGRDLALLARGFVRARQQSTAVPWVQALERQWKDLRPSLEPHSLSLLIVSLSKLQCGLPAKSACLSDLLRVFMQRAGSMSQQQLVMVAAGLSRLSSRAGYPPTALALTWRFLLKDLNLLTLNYTWVQSLLSGLRRQEGEPVPSALSALSKLFADFEDVRGLPLGLRDEALAFQSKFGALEGHVVEALVESALSSAGCTLSSVIRCLTAVARLPWQPSAAVQFGSRDSHSPHAAVTEDEDRKARLFASVQNCLKALVTDEKRHGQKAREAAAAALSAFCCLTPSQRCGVHIPLCQSSMISSHSNDEPAEPARVSEVEALPLQYELVPTLARILASKSEVSRRSEAPLWDGAAAVVKMTFRLQELARTPCASANQQPAALSFHLEQLKAATQGLLNAATSTLAYARPSSSGVLPIAGASWLAFTSSVCRRGVQLLGPRISPTELIEECPARAATDGTRLNTYFTTEGGEGLSQRHLAIITSEVSPNLFLDSNSQVANTLELTASEVETLYGDLLVFSSSFGIYGGLKQLPTQQIGLRRASCFQSANYGRQGGETFTIARCRIAFFMQNMKRRFAKFGLYTLAKLLAALLALRLRIHLLHHQNQASEGGTAGGDEGSSSTEHLEAQMAITSATTCILNVIKSTDVPKGFSCDSNLYSLLAISAQVLKALEPLIWERHASSLHYCLKAVARRSTVHHHAKSAAFSPLSDGVSDTPLWSWAESKRKASQAVLLAVTSLTSANSTLHAQASQAIESCESGTRERITLLSSRALPFFGSVRGLQVEIEQGPKRARVVFVVISSDDFLVPLWAAAPSQNTGTKAEQFTVCWQHEVGILQPLVAMELFAICSNLSGALLGLGQHLNAAAKALKRIHCGSGCALLRIVALHKANESHFTMLRAAREKKPLSASSCKWAVRRSSDIVELL
ncbi:hypothetical protein Esti_003532 [Eimeria stiedai]